LGYWQELSYWGKKYYNIKRHSELKRYIIYMGRGIFNRGAMEKMLNFFNKTQLRRDFAEKYSFLIPLTTRAVFYKDPKLADVTAMVQGTVGFLEERYHKKMFAILDDYELWSTDFNGEKLSINTLCTDQMEKEGIITVELKSGGDSIYKIALCIAGDKQNAAEKAFYIGAMQGMHGDRAAEKIKSLTKFCFAYRTKNLILYAVREIAKCWDIKHIYAVSNGGYFANSHMRVDKKIKTDLNGFWEETGGTLCEDKIFYKLPVEEYRKSIEEVKTHKRNLYRKRFALLDEIAASIKAALA
jgi:hypothetical protein